MRILQINKFFYSRRGAETVLLKTIEGLKERGHDVAEFAMQHPKNLPSAYSRYFASEIPELLTKQSAGQKLHTLIRLFYSPEINKKLTALARDFKPQVAHLHNLYHHLSASSFTTLFKLKIPTVMTLHDMFVLCPNHTFLRGNTLDEAAYKPGPYTCVRYKCVDNRLAPSIVATLEAYYYRYKCIWDRIDLFICPSQFMADKMVEWGYPRSKMRILHNPFNVPDSSPVLPLGTKILFLGSLSIDKGMRFLLPAAKNLPQCTFVLVGTGPEEAWIDRYIAEHKLKNVERWGWVPHGSERYFDAIRQAKVMVTPSLFYENCSMTILETLYYGRLAVSINRGGNPELITEGETGFLAAPENTDSLTEALRRAMETTDHEALEIQQAGRRLVETSYNPQEYITGLEKIYAEISRK